MASNKAVPSAYDSGMRGKEKPKKGNLRSIRISPAENGHTVTVEHEGAKGEYLPSVDHVFNKPEDVVEFITKHLTGKSPAKA